MSIFKDYLPKDEFLYPAWIGGLSLSIRTDITVEKFRIDSGITWVPARRGIDKMMDNATEMDIDFLKRFADWYNKNIWDVWSESKFKREPRK